jgi:hypothetical protein
MEKRELILEIERRWKGLKELRRFPKSSGNDDPTTARRGDAPRGFDGHVNCSLSGDSSSQRALRQAPGILS